MKKFNKAWFGPIFLILSVGFFLKVLYDLNTGPDFMANTKHSISGMLFGILALWFRK